MAEKIAGTRFVATNIFDRGIMLVLSTFLTPAVEAYIRVLWNHYGNFPLFAIFSLIRLIWNFLHFGLYCRLVRRIRPGFSRDYDDCARIEKILWTCKATPIDESRLQYYMTAHEGFAHPSIVLGENFMLARVFRDRVVFVDFGKPVQTNYTARTATFLWDELIFDAQRLVTIPTSAFIRLANEGLQASEKIDNRSRDLSILFGTGRCGSTLLAKIVDRADPDCLVLSEPVAFLDTYRLHQRIPPKEFRAIFLSMLRLLCKPYPGVKRYFFKPICVTITMGREIHRILPETNVLYCYRDPLKTAWAHERAFGVTIPYQVYTWFQWFQQLYHFEKLSGLHPNYRMDDMGYVHLKRACVWEVCFMMWAAHHLSHAEQKKEFKFPAICYEDVFKNPVEFCENILRLSGYDLKVRPELLEGAMRALSEDSQEGRSISQRQLNGFPLTKMTPEIWTRISGFCKALDLPLTNRYRETKKSADDKVFLPPQLSNVHKKMG